MSDSEESKTSQPEGPQDFDAQFKLKNVYDKEGLETALKTVQDTFYARLKDAKLVKREGKVPFVEHLSLIGGKEVELPESEKIHEDLRRELVFYNTTLTDAKEGVKRLIQSKVKIGRPDDFFAEMYKTDKQMARIKSKMVAQQQRIKEFSEKRQKQDNKKFEKSIRHFKMQEKHAQKRQNLEGIKKFKTAMNNNNSDSLDINEYLKDKKKQKKNVMEIMKQEHSKKKEAQKKMKRQGKANRKSNRSRNRR